MRGSSKIVTVIQGEFSISADPDVTLTTVLGSCISVCLFDPFRKVGGMNHFLLATSRNDQKGDLKYGVHAMELLINHLLHAGASRQDLLAKVFGGARMLEHSGDIGRTNASFALDFLDKEGITCLAQSVGGTSARRIRFHPTSGAAQQMQVKTAVRETPVPVAPKADVTLF